MQRSIQNGLFLLFITVVLAISISGLVSATAVNEHCQDQSNSNLCDHQGSDVNDYGNSIDENCQLCQSVCNDRQTCENNVKRIKCQAKCIQTPCIPTKVKRPKCLSIIGDRVWNDINTNGIQDPDEKGVANVKVNLWTGDVNGPLKQIKTTKTDENGIYYFTNLVKDIYWLQFILPSVTDGTWKFSLQNQGTDDTIDSDPNASGIAGPIDLGWCICDPSWDAGLVFTPSAEDGGGEQAAGGEGPTAAGGEELIAAGGEGPIVSAAGEVTMQEAGIPVGMLVMAILAVLAGSVIPKRK